MDEVITDMLGYVAARHAEADHESEMPALAQRLGYRYRADEFSFYDPETGAVHVDSGLPLPDRRADAAHELAHALLREGDPSYEAVIRRYHASVPDMHAHLEVLHDHGGDRLLMPDRMVETVFEICGTNAHAVWVLHQTARVKLGDALRRFVHARPDARMGGFVAIGGSVVHAASWRWHMPFWRGDTLPDDLEGPGVSLFPVPGRRSTVIGLIVIEE